MKAKHYSVLALAAMLIACKPAAQPDAVASESSSVSSRAGYKANDQSAAAMPQEIDARGTASIGTEPDSLPPFEGSWTYVQSCGWQHAATLELKQTGRQVTGSWSDGHRVSGDDGLLRGDVRENRLWVQFCSEGAQADAASRCPNFGSEFAYLVRSGAALEWYRKFGSEYKKYLVLHRVIEGEDVPVDDDCPEEGAP